MNEQQLVAVKQALEALKKWDGIQTQYRDRVDNSDAITALQSIISQDALDKKAENARELGLDYEPAPVKTYHDGKPWPVAPKPWVGLTDEEIKRGWKESWVDKQAFEAAVWWAEKKLKEKNT
jgi:hypothetical protein